jgi:hypothetical protein
MTTEAMLAQWPWLAAVERVMPGIAATLAAVAAGDPDATHRLEALISCPPPPSSAKH